MATRDRTDQSTARRPAPPVREAPPANLLIPPNPAGPAEEAVRARAYQLWEQAGRPDGDGAEFWLEAERELSRR